MIMVCLNFRRNDSNLVNRNETHMKFLLKFEFISAFIDFHNLLPFLKEKSLNTNNFSSIFVLKAQRTTQL